MRLTADGQLAVIHDATVDRTTTATGPVADYTAAQLAQLDARAGLTDGWPEPVGVPLLSDVLRVYAGDVRFAIEIKTDTPDRLERICPQVIEHVGCFRIAATVTVTSFDPVALEIMRRLAPELPRAYIGAYDTPAFLEAALRLECRQADIPVARGSAEVVREAQAHGLRVVGWLGNTPEQLHTLLSWDVNGITTDYPSTAIAYLRERGITSVDTWS